MPHLITELYENRLGAKDGDIGHVKDAYFDDRRWQIRYVIADTGSWLPRRQVLLAPRAFGPLERDKRVLTINLTRQQIEDSPPIDFHRPVSRQYEAEYFRYYGWPVYWVSDGFGGLGGFPGIISVPAEREPDAKKQAQSNDPHLHSTRAVAGYQVHALDGAVGHVSDFVVDDKTWAIREIIVQTGHWYSSKKVRVSPRDIERISYQRSALFVLLSRDDFHSTGEDTIVEARHPHLQAIGIEE